MDRFDNLEGSAADYPLPAYQNKITFVIVILFWYNILGFCSSQ